MRKKLCAFLVFFMLLTHSLSSVSAEACMKFLDCPDGTTIYCWATGDDTTCVAGNQSVTCTFTMNDGSTGTITITCPRLGLGVG